MRLIAPILSLAIPLAVVPGPAAAQTEQPAYKPGASVTDTNPQPTNLRCWDTNLAKWLPCVIGGRQESVALAASNTPAAAMTVYGGDYILTQTCTGYGTLAFQVLGPDGLTWLSLGSYTSADSGSGHGFALGSNARVRVTVAGTTGCAAILSRVPA